ncbi:hypothetical protein AZE42_05696 [Rhizopogon vesiculosus]|uniref:Uncharacterized protein n=1 Tax=Rhizopogon vesiculosus TaxID=180088 RepID=A0A1J8QPG6_9AGAM|nr:hypothetical protein AZE42_05696 [Rhizopogon vesiculosus]
MPRTASSPSSVSHSNISALYHLLWWQQERSIIRRGLCYNVEDLEDHDQVHPFTCDTLDLSQYPSAKLPNGVTSMLICSEYDLFFKNVSKVKHNFVIHGETPLPSIHPRYATFCSQAGETYQIDQSNTFVMCFTADGGFVLPQEARDRHPLFQRDDVLHLIDNIHEAPRTHQNTVHTRALMWSTCGKAIFTTFWPGGLGFKIEWPGAVTAGDHDVEFLRQAYVHFGSNAYICLRVAQLPSRIDRYVNVLEGAHDHYWTLNSSMRELESQYSRSLFAVQPPGDTRTEPISYPVSQFASRLLADQIVSSDPSSAMEYSRSLFAVQPPGDTHTEPICYPVSQFASRLLADRIVSSEPSSATEAVDNLLNLIDTRDAGEALYRHTVIALMSKFGGTFELRRPDWQGHCEPALEDFVLRARDAAYKEHAYEPSPLQPWKLIVATRGQPTPYPFKLSGSQENQHYYFQFWDPRIKSYFMHLCDTDHDLNSSSSPYEQWGFPYQTARKNSNRLMRRLANWLGHLVWASACNWN